MVFNGLCEHLLAFANICERASHAFIFSSKSSDQICLASTEHLRKYLMSSSEHFVNSTHVTREILTDAIDNNCIAKSFFHFSSSTRIISGHFKFKFNLFSI